MIPANRNRPRFRKPAMLRSAFIAAVGTIGFFATGWLWHRFTDTTPRYHVMQSDMPCGVADYKLGTPSMVMVSVPGADGAQVFLPAMVFKGKEDYAILCRQEP